MTGLIVGDVDYVDAGEGLWVWEKELIPFDEAVEDYHRALNIKEVVWDLKLLVSTAKFEVAEMKQDSLPAPGSDAAGSKGIKRRSRPDSEDWCTEMVTIVIQNPDYKEPA